VHWLLVISVVVQVSPSHTVFASQPAYPLPQTQSYLSVVARFRVVENGFRHCKQLSAPPQFLKNPRAQGSHTTSVPYPTYPSLHVHVAPLDQVCAFKGQFRHSSAPALENCKAVHDRHSDSAIPSVSSRNFPSAQFVQDPVPKLVL